MLRLAFLLALTQDPSPAELLDRLKADATRQAALVELLRRSGNADELAEKRRDPELVVCPQENGRPPLYALLSRFLPSRPLRDDFLPPDRLFANPPGARHARKTDAVLDVFGADGRLVKPYGGNNVINDGFLRDLDGDGLVERLDTTKYGIANSEVLELSTLLESPRHRLTVILNFDMEKWAYDWSFDVSDDDKDGAFDLHLGPKTEGGVERKVTFRWDAAKRHWTGPAGGPGDHFRVIDPAKIWPELRKLEEAKISFPREPERGPSIRDLFGGPEEPAPADPDVPYARRSLKGLDDAAILAYMRSSIQGRSARAVEPPGLAALDPKAAALAFVEANRTKKHRGRVRLAVDDLDGAAAPEWGWAAFTNESSRCYNAVDRHWYLRCDPKGSWLAYALSWEEGVALRGRQRDGKIFDLKVCDLDAAEARQALQVLWWLSRIRSKEEPERDGHGFSSSTADGRGALRLSPGGIDFKERIWFRSLAQGWEGAYTKETCVNFAQAYIEDLLPRRLGARWPTSTFDFMNATLREGKPGQIEAACVAILRRAAADENAFSGAVVRLAVDAAGALGLAGTLPDLRKLDLEGPLRGSASASIKKIEGGGDPRALEAQATRGHPNDAWALDQLRRRFPDLHATVLERRVLADPGPENAQLFRRLLEQNPERARALAAKLNPRQTDALAIEAFAALAAGPIPQEKERTEALVEIAIEPSRGWELRARAIDLLAYSRLALPAVDDALLQLMDPTKGGQRPPLLVPHAVEALTRRSGGRHAKAILAAFRAAEDSFYQQSMLPDLARAARDAREDVAAALRQEFKSTQLMLSELAWCAWAADLRELKPEIERAATATPGAPEGARANTAGGGVKDVEGRCHAARQVAALWNEEDVATRLKLLIALAVEGRMDEGQEQRLEKEAVEAARLLDAEGRREVGRFLAARPEGSARLERLRALLK